MGGQKMIWDAPEYDKPGKIPVTTQPGDYAAFDRTPMVKQMQNQLMASQGVQQAQAGGRASKLGVGRSSGTVGQMEGIAGDTQNRIQSAKQQAALDTFKEQLGQQEFHDQMANSRYKDELALYEAEKNRRRQPLGPFGSMFQ